jgi:hypothetical protein
MHVFDSRFHWLLDQPTAAAPSTNASARHALSASASTLLAMSTNLADIA